MNSKEAIERIKIMLGMEPKEDVKEDVKEEPKVDTDMTVELAEIKLKDGTTISYDKLEIGGKIQIKDMNNQFTQATEGEYELENGTKLKVDAQGIVTAVETNPEPQATPEVPTPETPEVEVETPDAKIMVLEQRVAKLEEALNMMLENFSKQTENFSKKIEEISEQPAAVPVFAQKVELKQTEQKYSRLDIIDKFKSIKK